LAKVVTIGTRVIEVMAGIYKYTKTATTRETKKSIQYIFFVLLSISKNFHEDKRRQEKNK
jgi:hypothetical protein